MEMVPLQYRGSVSDLSATTENQMESICDEVLLQKSIEESEEIKEPSPTNYAHPETHNKHSPQYKYTKLSQNDPQSRLPKKQIPSFSIISEHRHTSKHDVVNSDSSTGVHIASIVQFNKPYQHKWRKLLTNLYFWTRLIILILTVIIFCISFAYCIGQIVNVKLEIIKSCQPKTREEIWTHSYQLSLKQEYQDENGEFVLNRESVEAQYGDTEDSCWTTRKIEVNTHNLWYSNNYIYEYHVDNILYINMEFILFGLIALYALVVILYNIIYIIMDIVYVKYNTIHRKSMLFKKVQETNQQKPSKNKFCGQISKCWNGWNDTTFWTIRSLSSELIEFTLQTQALLLYNGYYIFDRYNEDNVYLAAKSEFITLFAGFLGFNCFGSGILWLSYSLASQHCHGFVFKLLIYFVDQFSDLFYALFPFIVIVYDNYNDNDDILMNLYYFNNITLKF